MQLYIPIQKVDEEKRLVYGIASAEEIDHMGEIFDYASSKPYIAAWSKDFQEKTGGKSFGNLRAMHQAISAGVLTDLKFDDEKKAVLVCAKVVDEAEWKKVLAGVYTGFSFGGQAVQRWANKEEKGTRYTLDPSELSLADKPCVPSAVFEIIKTDGSVEKRPFQKKEGGKDMDKIAKNMDMTQFLQLMNNVKEGLAEDEKTPTKLMEAVDNLIAVLTESTGQGGAAGETKEEKAEEPGGSDEKVVESGCDTEKVDLAAEIQKAFAPLAKSLQSMAGLDEAVAKVAGSVEALQNRLAKIETQAAPPKAFAKVTKADDGKESKADPAASALEEIKKIQNAQTWAY